MLFIPPGIRIDGIIEWIRELSDSTGYYRIRGIMASKGGKVDKSYKPLLVFGAKTEKLCLIGGACPQID